jgi:hypothetical protein
MLGSILDTKLPANNEDILAHLKSIDALVTCNMI